MIWGPLSPTHSFHLPLACAAMIFDRILEDSLNFVRRLLWARQNPKRAVTARPFHPTRTLESDHGIVSLLEGRDTPRAIRTWLYSPKRRELNAARMVATTPAMDLHLYCDFLGPLPQAKTPQAEDERKAIAARRERGESVPSHRIQIFKASHFLNKEGFYDYELVFWQDRDCFLSQGPDPNKAAQILMDHLAKQCLKVGEPLTYKTEDWQELLDRVWSEVKAALLEQPSAAS